MKTRFFQIFVLTLSITVATYAQNAIQLIQVTTGLNQPVDIANAGGSDLYVSERPGMIQKINAAGVMSNSPFLDITDRVVANAGERGLLGIVFHPDFPDSSYLYCNYTAAGNTTRISRFDVVSIDSADKFTEQILLTFIQPYTNHNGGDLVFDNHGHLIIASGDGGSGGDPQNNSQNKNSLLGKILRIDVNGGSPYAIPSDNPFVGQSNVREEILAYGLRNPWRISYDEITNSIYVGDVGQNVKEEISKIVFNLSDPNFGWRCYEGTSDYNLDLCEGVFTIPPIYDYQHDPDPGCSGSITGGFVYRGANMPLLYGKYVFADYCNGYIACLDLNTFLCDTLYGQSAFRFTTFGEDAQKELYTVNVNTGILYRLSSPVAPPNDHIFTINLDGAQVPPSGTGSLGTGYGIATFESTSRIINVSGFFVDLTGNPTASHVHLGTTGTTGGVLFSVTRTNYGPDTVGFYGTGSLSVSQATSLLTNNGLYVNIHSDVNPGGEIRGQIVRVDCPTNYKAHAPKLPKGTYPVKDATLMGSLLSNRNMIVRYETTAEILAGFNMLLGTTLDVTQAACP